MKRYYAEKAKNENDDASSRGRPQLMIDPNAYERSKSFAVQFELTPKEQIPIDFAPDEFKFNPKELSEARFSPRSIKQQREMFNK